MSKNYEYELPNHNIKFKMVKLASLLIEPQAQRTLDERRAAGIARKLVESAVGTIVVSERADGSQYIVDGMHRGRAVSLCGWTEIMAEVHYGLTIEEEAVLFLIKNKESKGVNALDQYHVGLTAGVPLYVEIQTVLDKHGLRVGPASSTNNIAAIRGLEDAMRRWGADVLDRTLTIAERAWGRGDKTWDGTLIGGLAEFLGKYGTLVDDDKLVAKIARKGDANVWLGLATKFMLGDSGGAAVSKRAACCTALKVIWNTNLPATSKVRIFS